MTPAADRTVTWRELLAETVGRLRDAGLQHADLDARRIVEEASGVEGSAVAVVLGERATERGVARLDEMVRRRSAGEPLQYVLGRWGFRTLDLMVDPRVLVPRPETEVVTGVALSELDRIGGADRPTTVVDLGTGSGAIGLAVADELPLAGTTVWITDADAGALDLARANLPGIGRAAINVRVAHGSWFDALPDGLRFDVIVANPPYVAEGSSELEDAVREWEPHGALFSGADGLDDIRHLVRGAPAHLAAGGWLVLEIGADQGAAVRKLFESTGYADIEIRADLAGHDRIALGRIRQ